MLWRRRVDKHIVTRNGVVVTLSVGVDHTLLQR